MSPTTTATTTGGGELPDIAYAAALAGLPSMTLSRLGALLHQRSAEVAWRLAARTLPGECAVTSVAAVWQRCVELGIWVCRLGDPQYPAQLAADPAAPPVLFGQGDAGVLELRRAAVVGTRSGSAAGRAFAARLGFELAEAGVSVVSGLARGVDGAAHQGALSAVRAGAAGRPAGVVACGLDVPYPREHRALYAAVAQAGVLLSEVPPGTEPRAFRFPLRNRIVAALAEVVVVVESRVKGGSLITVEEANRRDVPVMAVPGAVCNPAAGGVNGLLRDGALIVTEPADVLTVLSIDHRRHGPAAAGPSTHRALFEACLGGPRTLEQLALHTGHELGEVATALRALVAEGWLSDDGGWYEPAEPMPAGAT